MGHSFKCGVGNAECGVTEESVRARADSPVLELEVGRDSGGRGVRTRRGLTKFSNQLCFGFRILQLVVDRASSLRLVCLHRALPDGRGTGGFALAWLEATGEVELSGVYFAGR